MMKKLLLALTALLVLAGCANKEASTSSNEVIFKVGSKTVNQEQLFHVMKSSDAGKTAIREAQDLITKDVTDEDIADEVAELLAKQKEDLKDQFLEEVQKLGYETEEDYVENNLKPYARLRHFLETDLNENFKRLAQDLIPRKIKVLQIKDKENLDKAKEMLADKSSLEDIAKALDEDVTQKGVKTLELMSQSKLPQDVIDFLKENNEPAVSEVLETGTDKDQYYIAELVSADVATFKDDVIEKILSDNTLTQKELGRIYKENNFKVYDEGIYNALKKSHPEYLAN